MTHRLFRFAAAAMLPALIAASAAAQPKNMIGRQSQNEGIFVLPRPGGVTVDGKLDDWDFSGRIWVFADTSVRGRYSVEVAAMWDARHLYLAAKWRDPTPMHNTVDPKFNPNDGWKADSWQMRIRTDRTLWVTTWYYAPKKQPVMHLAYWQDEKNSRAGQDVVLLTAEPGSAELGRGAEMAYRKTEDGKGFVQEIKIPWKLLYRQPPSPRAGQTFRLGNEFLWGDPTGRTWPVHRYADNMQPGHTSREFYWTAVRAWGDAKLLDKNDIPRRKYVDATAKLPGTVPVRVRIPAGAARFTVVIEDDAGRRVRNLAGDFDPQRYGVEVEGETRVCEVLWDCLDDNGRLVEPGTYRTRGLTHAGLAAEYEMCFYNPGTPPWRTRDGSGAWGADHGAPLRVAAAGDWVIVSWPFAEGGSGILGVGPDGLKKWGEKRGAYALAADEEYVYAITSSWHAKGRLCRMSRKDGSYAPFVLNGKPRPFEMSLVDLGLARPGADDEDAQHKRIVAGGDLTKVEGTGKVLALAVDGEKLLLAIDTGKLAVLDAESAEVRRVWDVGGLTGLAARDGRCYGLADGKVVAIDLAKGATEPAKLPGAVAAAAIALDGEGNLLVADVGPDSQVKAFTPAGKLAYTCGKRGGRVLPGPFDPQTMTAMSSVTADAAGNVWVVEHTQTPRRVSVWGRDGKLVRDYVGNTGYAGTGSFLHETNPGLGYVGPVEVALDKAERDWNVTRVLWAPDEDAGEDFPISTGTHVLPQRFTREVDGKPREYLYVHDPRDSGGQVVYMKFADGWRPVAAVCLAGHISGGFTHHGEIIAQPTGEMAGLNGKDGVFWNDADGDGKVQRGECEIVPTDEPGDAMEDELPAKRRRRRGEGALSLRNGWGGRIGEDLTIYCDGLVRYKPVGFTEAGAPRYGKAGMERFGPEERGDLVPVDAEDLLLCLSFKGYAQRTTGMLGVDMNTGKVRWSYPNPYPGVHGSHRAPMPEPGLLIGPLKICGVAHVNDRVGRVFVMRGNLGQDFFMTTDGLFVGAMFQDGRLPGESLPAKEASLVGMPMEAFSHGGEPFNGWFGKQSDGAIRMTCGFARQACMILQVKGLDTVRRFKGPELDLDAAAVRKANEDNGARALAAAKPKELTVGRLTGEAKIDGQAREWPRKPEIEIARAGRKRVGTARLAWDAETLYAYVQVSDPSPWVNLGKDATRLFKTGDAVDIQLATMPEDPEVVRKHRKVRKGDLRVVLSKLGGKPVAVLMRPIEPEADRDLRVLYRSPVGEKTFDRVEVLAGAKVAVRTGSNGYSIEAAIPTEALGLEPKPGLRLLGDIGVIASDADGRINTARTYWANPHTNLVNDLPHEAWLTPRAWGTFVFQEK